MKIIATFKELLRDFSGEAVVSLKVSNIRHQLLLKELDPSKTYSVEIKEIKSKRSSRQNRYMWALLREIDIKLNGKPTEEGDWEIYILCLEKAGAKCDYIAALPETERALKENFRAVKFIKKVDLNGKEGNMYKVYIGSSKMNTKEMNVLIDAVLDVANEVGVETDYWKEMLK